MRISSPWLAWIAVCLFAWPGCSDQTAGCRYDVDCPGTLRCVEGVCRFPHEPEPCAETLCTSDEICVAGVCVDKDTDADEDGWTVQADCDDADPAVYPGAAEVCNQLDDDCDDATDEDLFCGQDCAPTDAPPASEPPATCDQTTACERCFVYESTHYYCRDLAGAGYAWLALPQMTPCGSAQHCRTMTCEQTRHFHCDARVGAYLAGAVPTAEPETCNGFDDNCDGATDEPGAEAHCPPRDQAAARCEAGACLYTCEPSTHDCAGACLDDNSPDSCGERCTPCLPPANADALCTAGACDHQCRPGHTPEAGACAPCDRDQACGPSCSACPPGQSCCGDGCYDLLADPTHCGDCELTCPLASDSCCAGQGCCQAAHPRCCGQRCCADSDQCCPGDYCCDPAGSCCGQHCCPGTSPNCCGDGCCAAADACCNQTMCCPPSHPHCCPDGCCPSGSGVCCADGCCPDNTACCNSLYCCDPGETCCTNGCCPASHPVCCGDGCCPAGTVCCNNQTQCCPVKGPPVPKKSRNTEPLIRPARTDGGGQKPVREFGLRRKIP